MPMFSPVHIELIVNIIVYLFYCLFHSLHYWFISLLISGIKVLFHQKVNWNSQFRHFTNNRRRLALLPFTMHSSCITITIIFHLPLKIYQTVASVHSYNTRLASKSTYYINTIKTNYGKFNIRFAAVKV